jgi:hypothetical protein
MTPARAISGRVGPRNDIASIGTVGFALFSRQIVGRGAASPAMVSIVLFERSILSLREAPIEPVETARGAVVDILERYGRITTWEV